MKKFIKIIALALIIFPLLPAQKVLATDIDVSIDLTFSVDAEGEMHIKQVRTIKNNSSRFYIKADSSETFIISSFKIRSETSEESLDNVARNIQLTDLAGTDLNPSIEKLEDSIKLTVPYGLNLNKNQTKTFVLEYDNYELVEKTGNIWNAYVPPLAEDYNKIVTAENGSTSQTNYSVSLELSKSLGQPNFVLPEPENTYDLTDFTNYVFDPSSLVEQTAWVQIGNRQFYSFTIVQPVSSVTNLKSKVFNTWYDLLLPRESDSGNQKVYFESISPEPMYIKQDEEGNVTARFTFSSEDNTEIVVKGFITSNITDKISKEDVGNVGDIDLTKFYATVENEELSFRDLLSSQKYWEVDASEIQSNAAELKSDLTNALELLLVDYNFVTEKVDYDNLKTGINNTRQGAINALHGESSVCMEYADLLITLLRAQGIPARASFGYGFDPKAESDSEEGHQWVEAYLPNIGWVAVDPTWGDTGRKSYIGGDVDHALWYVAAKDVETPSPVVKYSISDTGAVSPPRFEIQAQESVNLESLTTLDELLSQYKYTPKHQFTELLARLNIYGKVIFIGVPLLIIILLILTFLMSIRKLIRKVLSRNYVHARPASHDVPNNPYY